MFYTYILESEVDRKYRYTGYTSDLKKRFIEHNVGTNRSTKPYRPFKLIYYEACVNIADAKRREKYLKTSQGKRFVGLRLKEYIQLSNNSRRISAES